MARSTRVGDGVCPDYAYTPIVDCSNLVVNGGEYSYDEATKDGKPAADTIPGCFTVKKQYQQIRGSYFLMGRLSSTSHHHCSLFNSCNVNIVFYRQEDVWVCGVEHTIPARDNASPCEEIDPEEFE